MNKLYKIILGVFIIGSGIINTTNAGNITLTGHVNFDNNLFSGNFSSTYLGSQPYFKEIGEIENGGRFNNVEINCNFTNVNISQYLTNMIGTKNTSLIILTYYANNKGIYNAGNNTINISYNDILNGNFTTTQNLGASTYKYNKLYGYYGLINSNGVGVDCVNNTCYLDYDFSCVLSGDNIGNLQNANCPTCPTCEEQYTSLECQTEYNLIPIENVTANYCKLNYDLIEPTECPNIGEGTGEINWTAWYINNQQYPGTASLKLNIADFLERQTTYNQDETIVDVIGYDADEDYINDIIDKEQLTPTKDDFAYLISNLGDYIPLFAVAGLIIRARRIIKKVF